MDIENNSRGYVALWKRVDEGVDELRKACKRVSVRNMTRMVMGKRFDDETLWGICNALQMGGHDPLPLPEKNPYSYREILRQVSAVMMGIKSGDVNLVLLDAAYGEVFPESTRINVNKKKLKK